MQQESGESPLARLAAICSLFFGSNDLTISDVMAALMLVGIRQRLERQQSPRGASGC